MLKRFFLWAALLLIIAVPASFSAESERMPKEFVDLSEAVPDVILMVRGGFEPLDTEWWHFTLADEPYPDTYFDYPVDKYKKNN